MAFSPSTLRRVLVAVVLGSSGCSAAVGAAMAAGEIRQGIAGLQQLVSSTRRLPESVEAATLPVLGAPVAGTYRGVQVLGRDTLRLYVRTAREALAPIVEEGGAVTGYAVAALAAASLDSLEARVGQWTDLRRRRLEGRAIFFVEGTQPPNVGGRTLYPAAFLGRIAPGESEVADRQDEALRELGLVMDAPNFDELAGQGISHELFGSVAEGVFTLRANGSSVYRQEYTTADERLLILHFERISATTLP